MMLKFCQPTDYHHRGRNLWFNPADVVSIKRQDDMPFDRCLITLRTGEAFTIAMDACKAAEKINEALKEEK